MVMGKTVYVLGAGFSTLAKLPPQADIINRIFSPTTEQFMSNKILIKTITRFENARKNIAKFLLTLFSNQSIEKFAAEKIGNSLDELSPSEREEVFNALAEDLSFWQEIYKFIREKLSGVTLEDIFTILDKAVVSNEHIQGYNLSKIIALREDIIFCIIRLFVAELSDYKYDTSVYIEFVKKILNLRFKEGQEKDPVSIITLNWDALLDIYFNEVIKTDKKYENARLDYCIYDYEYDHFCEKKGEEKPIPSTLLKNLNYFNIKYIKLHGSMNWLICKNCRRLFYSVDEYIALKEFEKNSPQCPFCKENYSSISNDDQTNLKSELITPTLIKNLDNVNFKSMWKNAFVELSEADKIVFIGYSLPQADFELRYMLKKSIKPNTEIEVVLYLYDDPDRLNTYLKDEEGIRLYNSLAGNFAGTRFTSFFGGEQIKFYYEGLESYVSDYME